MARVVKLVVENCGDCPYSWHEDDPDPMGGYGWKRCQLLPEKTLDSRSWREDVDRDCPLPLAKPQDLGTAPAFGL